MSATDQPMLSNPARVGEGIFIGVTWGGVALTILFITFRFIVRVRVFGRLQVDDGLVLFSWIALLLNASLWQVCKDALYENIAVYVGHIYPPPLDYERRSEGYLRKSVAVIVFFYTGLWSIKLAFLLFFKRLGRDVRHQNKIWWVVLSITVATYVICLGTIEYSCLASSFSYVIAHCANKTGPIRFQRLTLRANMILDVVTDALIIFVPVNLLRKTRLSVRKKFALGSLFSITLIIMVFAIIRVVVVSSYSKQPDPTWLYLWSSVEQAVSIVVACLASFPALFKSSEPQEHRSRTPGRLCRIFCSFSFAHIKSNIMDHVPLRKRSKHQIHDPADLSSTPKSTTHHHEAYLETQMLKSVDGKGKFLQSGNFPLKDWNDSSALNSHSVVGTETSCYSHV